MVTIYLAAGLFNVAERLHNLFLEKELKKLVMRLFYHNGRP